ncbi:MAG TPA: YggS family pyridoxal phosphate-dependent enzyme [Fimbriimonadales bacterium]|nr:YggS family pyridoxal phosphate-dependent enzyme [Fimbriimonadales bacterium]
MKNQQTMIAENVRKIKERIEKICSSCGRNADEITLIAATKGRTVQEIQIAYDAGIRDFGENYYQEAMRKRENAPPDIAWHFIGRIQSNKAKKIGSSFSMIHTIDRLDIARLVARGAFEAGREVGVFIEVNIAEEPQKGGIFPKEVAFFAKRLYSLSGIRLKGLMTMGPANLSAEGIRPFFKLMRELLEGLELPGVNCLSMGMSDTYEVAIQEGATHVRIGTALFGKQS